MSSCYEYEDVRYLRDRHNDGCDDTTCSGCQQCGERHCPECRKRTHLAWGENTCPACIGKVRTTLREIAGYEIERQVHTEALNKGIDSDAFWLTGPSANPEAWSWRLATAALDGERLNRNPQIADAEQWSRLRRTRAQAAKDAELLRFDSAIARNEQWSRDRRALASTWLSDERHPAYVLRTIIDTICDADDETYDRSDHIAPMADWIDARLTRVANDPDHDFHEIRTSVTRCKAHLESVLRDGQQRDTGAPHLHCGTALERTWGTDEKHDGWRCPRCRVNVTEAQYRLAVAEVHKSNAEWLTDAAMAARFRLKAGTIRSWARKGHVKKRRHSDRTEYNVADTQNQARRAGLLSVAS